MSNYEFDGPKSIKIRRIPKAGYFGLVSYPKATITLSCQIGYKGGHNTGLTPIEEKHYEELLGLKPGELGRHSKWWSDFFNVEHPIRLATGKANEIILDNPISQIKYKVLLAHDKVANSEIDKANPGAIFYVDNAELKAKKEVEVINLKMEGMKLVLKLSIEEKRNALRLFGKRAVDDVTESMASAQLYQEMEKDPKKFFEIMTDGELKTKMFIQELVEKGILKRTGNYYKHGDDTIANTTDECVAYFNDIKNQSVKLTLTNRLKKLNKEVA
jgi:hypothetical protein